MQGDQRPTILGLSIAFPFVSIIAVLLRFEARRIKRVKLEGDDWTILVALVGPSYSSLCIMTALTEVFQGIDHRCHYYCAPW